MKIRKYKPSDFAVIFPWWGKCGEKAPAQCHLSETDTFVAESNDRIVGAASLYVLGHIATAFADNLITNPEDPKPLRRAAGLALWEAMQTSARQLQYRRILCLTNHAGLVRRYQEPEYGLELVGTNLSCLVKHL